MTVRSQTHCDIPDNARRLQNFFILTLLEYCTINHGEKSLPTLYYFTERRLQLKKSFHSF